MKKLLLMVAVFFPIDCVHAVAPNQTINVFLAESKELRVYHAHNLLDGGDVSYICIQDKADIEQCVFKLSPPLRRIWIDEESKYIIGLSEVRFGNSSQIVIWGRTGTMLANKSIDCNYLELMKVDCINGSEGGIYWFDKDNPIQRFEVKDDGFEISLNETKPLACYLPFYERGVECEVDGVFIVNMKFYQGSGK